MLHLHSSCNTLELYHWGTKLCLYRVIQRTKKGLYSELLPEYLLSALAFDSLFSVRAKEKRSFISSSIAVEYMHLMHKHELSEVQNSYQSIGFCLSIFIEGQVDKLYAAYFINHTKFPSHYRRIISTSAASYPLQLIFGLHKAYKLFLPQSSLVPKL